MDGAVGLMRVLAGENANLAAPQQIRQLLLRPGMLAVPTLFVSDGGYDPVKLTI